MYGRDEAGHKAVIATHQPPPTTIAAAPPSSCRSRRANPVGAATRYISPKPGTTRNACIILVMKANPMSRPASSSQRVPAFSVARTMQ